MWSFIKWIILQSLLFILAQLTWVPQLLPAEESTKPTNSTESSSPADLMRAEAEKTKAKAEIEKNEIERAKIAVDLQRVGDARKQFYFSFFGRAALVVAFSLFILWLTPRVLPRLLKVGVPGIVQVELTEDVKIAWNAFHNLGQMSASRDLREIFSADSPRPQKELTGAGKYQYERLSHKLYWLFDVVHDPNLLDPKTRDQYRGLLKDIGTAAIAIGHYSKALDIILHLKQFTDRALDDGELLMVGNAYMWASMDSGLDSHEQKSYLAQAVPFFQDAYRIAKDRELKITTAYNLGWTLLAIEEYPSGAQWMETCVELDDEIAPWAKWAIACAQVKQGNTEKALNTLASIPQGSWWIYICKDEDFSDMKREAAYKDQFEELCSRYINS